MHKFIHSSYFFVAFIIGVIVGIFLVVVFRWNFFASPFWIVPALMLFSYSLIYPARGLIIVSFLAGMIVGFVRAVPSLSSEPAEFEQWSWLMNIQEWFRARIFKMIPEPNSNLGEAYLLGVKDSLPNDLVQALRTIGLSHIVVASGTHLSILTGAVKKIFGKISRFAGLLYSLLFILLFVVMIGWTPSILRAGIVSILSTPAWFVGRKFSAWRIVLIAMAITLLFDPTFVTNMGWQLSFASFGGVMVLAPKVTKFFYGDKKPNFIAKSIITSSVATIVTLPITIFYFGSFSLITILANLIILPTLPFAIGLLFMTGILADIPGIGMAIAFVTARLLDFHILIVKFFAEQKYFLVEVPKRNGWVFLIYAPIVLLFFIQIISHRKRQHLLR